MKLQFYIDQNSQLFHEIEKEAKRSLQKKEKRKLEDFKKNSEFLVNRNML